MDSSYLGLYLIINAIHIYLHYYGFEILLNRAKTQRNNIAVEFAFIIYFFAKSAMFLIFNKPELNFLISIVPLLLICLLYANPIKSKLFIGFITCGICLLLEMVVGFLFYTVAQIYYLDVENAMLPRQIIHNTFFFFLGLIFKKIRLQQKHGPINHIHWLAIITISMMSIIASTLLFFTQFSAPSSIVSICILPFINILAFWLFDKLTEYYSSIYQSDMLAQQNKAYTQQLYLIQNDVRAVRDLKHDLKNHLLFLSQYLQNNEIDSAQNYLQKIAGEITANKVFSQSGNPEIDAFLNYKLSSLEQIGASVTAKIAIPTNLNISQFNLCIILGNLLDNAYDAFVRLPRTTEKIYYLKIELNLGALYIRSRNTYDGQSNKKIVDGLHTYCTKKENATSHGRGMKSIEKIVSLYEGIISINDSNLNFDVEVALFPTEELNFCSDISTKSVHSNL